jgi:hypothetical protein
MRAMTSPLGELLESCPILALNVCPGPAADLRLRDQHEIEPENRLALVSTKNIA